MFSTGRVCVNGPGTHFGTHFRNMQPILTFRLPILTACNFGTAYFTSVLSITTACGDLRRFTAICGGNGWICRPGRPVAGPCGPATICGPVVLRPSCGDCGAGVTFWRRCGGPSGGKRSVGEQSGERSAAGGIRCGCPGRAAGQPSMRAAGGIAAAWRLGGRAATWAAGGASCGIGRKFGGKSWLKIPPKKISVFLPLDRLTLYRHLV